MDATIIKLPMRTGETLLTALEERGIPLAHECGGALACASCRVIVRCGGEILEAASEDELDMLERAGAAAPGARLACQAAGAGGEVEIEISGDGPVATAAESHAPVSLTERAARHFAAQLAKHPNASGVRLSVEPAGCSGFGYRVDPARESGAGDTVFESRGIRVLVDAESLARVQGTVLDVVQEGLGRRLRFDNPNARQGCGCGESFAL